MDDSQHLKEQREVFQRRLHLREMQATHYGIGVDPSIPMEIEDLKKQITSINVQILTNIPRAERKNLPKLWQRALKAYFSGQWRRAEDYFLQVMTIDPDYADVQRKLADTQTHLYLGVCYRAASELKAKGNWSAVLMAMDELERGECRIPDSEGLRRWAEEQRAQHQQKDNS